MDAMPQVDEAEFDILDRYLGSTDASEVCMLLSELDGFLTGLVVSPLRIPEEEWLPVALGTPPLFASDQQRALILDIVRRRVGQIEALLRQDPEAYAPVFWTDDEGEPIADDWAAGFRRAVGLRQDSWLPLFTEPEENVLVAPIVALWDDVISESDSEDADIAEAIEMAPPLIPAAVIGIYRFWYRRARAAGDAPGG
jgi:uncharacterized protein